jgi:hypothetical protein
VYWWHETMFCNRSWNDILSIRYQTHSGELQLRLFLQNDISIIILSALSTIISNYVNILQILNKHSLTLKWIEQATRVLTMIRALLINYGRWQLNISFLIIFIICRNDCNTVNRIIIRLIIFIFLIYNMGKNIGWFTIIIWGRLATHKDRLNCFIREISSFTDAMHIRLI